MTTSTLRFRIHRDIFTEPAPDRRGLRLALALLAGAAALAVPALSGCSDDFEPYGQLSALRVLAIQSDPVAPLPGASTLLTPLVYTAPGDAVTASHWSWCPFPGASTDGYPCLVTEAELAELLGQPAGSIPAFDLGSAPTAQLDHALDPAALRALCEGEPGQPATVDCTGGFPIQIRLAVETATGSIVAVRRLRLRLDDSAPANAIPAIDGLAAVVGGSPQPMGDDAAVTVPRDADTPLRASVAPEAAERYPAVDAGGQPVTRREQLTLTWFVECGETDATRTSFIDGVTPLEEAVETGWNPGLAADYPAETARIIVVLRDDRDGVAWRTASARLGGAP